MNLTIFFRERLAEKRARVQQIAKEAAALDKIVESDTQSKINIEGPNYHRTIIIILLFFQKQQGGEMRLPKKLRDKNFNKK